MCGQPDWEQIRQNNNHTQQNQYLYHHVFQGGEAVQNKWNVRRLVSMPTCVAMATGARAKLVVAGQRAKTTLAFTMADQPDANTAILSDTGVR